jgi:hypothetical protein
MDRRYVLGVALVAVLALGAWSWTQAQQPDGKIAAPAGDQFRVSPTSDSAVLLDTRSGKTWVLMRSFDGEHVWLPAKRIDSPDEARDWRKEQKRSAEERILTPKK